MTAPGAALRVVRASWPLLGAAWGAWTGFGGYLRLSHSADSFGSMLALGFFVVGALAGLIAGGAAGALIGGLVDALLRRLGMGVVPAALAATLVNALTLWQLVGLAQDQFPGLRAVDPAKAIHAIPAGPGPSQRSTCQEPPPVPLKERALWDAECR
jgi:hypothetical protein